MPQNFFFPQRDQPMLLPVDMREWLPEDRPRDRRAARLSGPARRQPALAGAAATRPGQPGTASAPGSPETNTTSSWSDSQWLLP
jgi:hypothetical protein